MWCKSTLKLNTSLWNATTKRIPGWLYQRAWVTGVWNKRWRPARWSRSRGRRRCWGGGRRWSAAGPGCGSDRTNRVSESESHQRTERRYCEHCLHCCRGEGGCDRPEDQGTRCSSEHVREMKYESHSQNHNGITGWDVQQIQRWEKIRGWKKDGRFIEEFKKKYLGKSDAMVKGIEQIKFSSSDG